MNIVTELARIQWAIVAMMVGLVVNLIAVGLAILRGGQWAGRVDTTLAQHTAELSGIKNTLGNGAPGTVVRVPVCQAMHETVRGEIRANREAREQQMTAIHEDIRSLHDAVSELHRR